MRNETNHNKMKTTEKIFGKYNVEKDMEAMVMRVTKDSPNSRFGMPKSVWAYRFRNEDHMMKYFNEWVERVTAINKEKEDHKNAKREAQKNMVNPFKVGDIVYDSWGYDQTNIDFYQIVKVGRKSVVIREIAQKMVEATGSMSEDVIAAKDEFVGEPMTKIIRASVHNGKVSYYIKSRHGWISPWDGRPKHQSHYH